MALSAGRGSVQNERQHLGRQRCMHYGRAAFPKRKDVIFGERTLIFPARRIPIHLCRAAALIP